MVPYELRIQFGSTDADGILFPQERSLIVTQYKEGVESVSELATAPAYGF